MGIKVVDDMFQWIKRQCKDDDTCVFIVLILIGLLLCVFFKGDGFANIQEDSTDKGLGDSVDVGETVYGFGKDAPHSADDSMYGKGTPALGLVPKPNRPDPVSPSMVEEMEVLGPVKSPLSPSLQAPGELVQDGSITKPFDEVWNPGYKFVEDAFQGGKGPASQGGFQATEGSRPMGTAPGMEHGLPGDAKGLGGGEGVNLTLYYAPWCPHCQKMMPEWKKFEDEYNGKSFMGKILNIFKVNSDEEPEKVKAAEPPVQGFPDLRMDGSPLDLKDRTKNGIVSSIKEAFSNA